MRITDIRERTVAISRYRDPAVPSGGLTTSIVAVATDVIRGGRLVIGYGFASIGRFGQGGLIRERFAPRLMAAAARDLSDDAGDIDPFRAWKVMVAGEKPGGHGDRSVAVGTLDMAIWDAAAKIAECPLYRYLMIRTGRSSADPRVRVYAGGGYYYQTDDIERLADEMMEFRDLGYTRAKIKIGAASMSEDLKRIDAAGRALGGANRLAVDAIYAYDHRSAPEAAAALAPRGLWWFEDICDPLDFETLAAAAAVYPKPIAAGEALFSAAEAKLLDRHGGLRRERDVLVFDPVHCYGIPGYLQIITALEAQGWPRSAFWPHGGHLFSLHLAAALGLGGAEANPLCFQPFGGYADAMSVSEGVTAPPENPGVGFEGKRDLYDLFRALSDR